MDGWMDGWTDGRTDEQTDGYKGVGGIWVAGWMGWVGGFGFVCLI